MKTHDHYVNFWRKVTSLGGSGTGVWVGEGKVRVIKNMYMNMNTQACSLDLNQLRARRDGVGGIWYVFYERGVKRRAGGGRGGR